MCSIIVAKKKRKLGHYDTGFVRMLKFPDQEIRRYQYRIIENLFLNKATFRALDPDLFSYLKNTTILPEKTVPVRTL